MPRRLSTAMVLTALLVVMPACSASAGHRWLRRDCPAGTAQSPSGNVVYRPAYPALRTKPLYISNYAGVQYPPVAPRAPMEPTGARWFTRRPFAGWLNGGTAAP